jgi:hypothetical protein
MVDGMTFREDAWPVIANPAFSGTKQSPELVNNQRDCFVASLLAMTERLSTRLSAAKLVSKLDFRASRFVTGFDNAEDIKKSDESENLMNRGRRI